MPIFRGENVLFVVREPNPIYHSSLLGKPVECSLALGTVEISHLVGRDRPDRLDDTPPVEEQLRPPRIADCCVPVDVEVGTVSQIGNDPVEVCEKRPETPVWNFLVHMDVFVLVAFLDEKRVQSR
jgi:hypothetical protein